jgi:hypothetical protein
MDQNIRKQKDNFNQRYIQNNQHHQMLQIRRDKQETTQSLGDGIKKRPKMTNTNSYDKIKMSFQSMRS